jgi:hypothetical protein
MSRVNSNDAGFSLPLGRRSAPEIYSRSSPSDTPNLLEYYYTCLEPAFRDKIDLDEINGAGTPLNQISPIKELP